MSAEVIIRQSSPEQVELFTKILQFCSQRCNGNITIDFASGTPRKLTVNTVESLGKK
jgi:hypothetical protein